MITLTKIKYISIISVKRILIYLAISILGWSVLYDQTTSIRNKVYGIGNYIDLGFISGMLAVCNVVFFMIFIIFLLKTRRHLYKSENRNSEKLKEYVKFETILEISITLGYVLITSVASIFISDFCIIGGLIVPVYCIYFLLQNIFVAAMVTVVVYLLLIFIILVLPYFVFKRGK